MKLSKGTLMTLTLDDYHVVWTPYDAIALQVMRREWTVDYGSEGIDRIFVVLKAEDVRQQFFVREERSLILLDDVDVRRFGGIHPITMTVPILLGSTVTNIELTSLKYDFKPV